MDPVTIALLISAAFAAAGSAYGVVQTKKAADYNEALRRQQADQEALDTQEALRRKRKDNEAFLSRQRAMRAKSGVDIASGSSLLVAAESASRLELEALSFAQGSDARREAMIASAKQASKQGNVALTSGLFQDGSSLMQGAAGAYGKVP